MRIIPFFIVTALQLDNGDVIDCVDFYSQPAMDDPYIRENAKLKARKAETKFHEPVNEKFRGVGPQRWSCPPGSVSFLKATKAGPLNYSALDSFTRSRAKFFSESNNIKPLDDPTQHERMPEKHPKSLNRENSNCPAAL
ncbi:hypothetical protein EJ110_NYTH01801 [Nymphaea thermarum]|nr:hypothetical protein EJ110_NYTH01801 [Nymphaea thermarum]